MYLSHSGGRTSLNIGIYLSHSGGRTNLDIGIYLLHSGGQTILSNNYPFLILAAYSVTIRNMTGGSILT